MAGPVLGTYLFSLGDTLVHPCWVSGLQILDRPEPATPNPNQVLADLNLQGLEVPWVKLLRLPACSWLRRFSGMQGKVCNTVGRHGDDRCLP